MKAEIRENALKNLLQTTGIEGTWRQTGPLDGTAALTINGRRMEFEVEVKNEIRPHMIPQLEDHFRNREHFMVLANRIYPKVKEELRKKLIPYLEANGNFFLKKNNLLVFVDTQKPADGLRATGNRAFTKTGLKVLFYLLQHKAHINLTQRELAEKTGVGLGNIPQVLEGLRETGFLIPLNKREWVWDHRGALLDRWVTEYGTVLKPKLKKEKYTCGGNPCDIEFNTGLTVWGGEPAADILTNHLRPEKFVLYTKENRTDLIKNYRLVPDRDGKIEVFEMFWKQEKQHRTAPAILVYADLLLEGGKRNAETAEIIMNEHITPNL